MQFLLVCVSPQVRRNPGKKEALIFPAVAAQFSYRKSSNERGSRVGTLAKPRKLSRTFRFGHVLSLMNLV